MRNLKVEDILNVTNGKLLSGDKHFICENFSKDTRTIQKDDTYIGIEGETFNGNLFWKQALDNGAKCVIVSGIEITSEEIEQYQSDDKIIIKVENSLEALYQIAKAKRELYNIPVIAITGSVGKTSTKDIVASVVGQTYKTLKTIGNNNNNIGLPFTILRLKDEEAMVLEMGMNHFDEISLLSKIATPNICIITNIGTSHIGNLGSRENILKAKLEILDGTHHPYIIINQDNDLLHDWYQKHKENDKIYTYGIKEHAKVRAQNIILNKENSNFTCLINDKKINITVPIGGEHFVLNALCAVCVGNILEIETDNIIAGIEHFELTKKRMDMTVLKDNIKIINDAYNASFESMQASLKNLSEFKENRKIAVLGDMFELGEFSIDLHKKVGEEVFLNKIDVLLCSGEHAKYIASEAIEKGMDAENVYYFKNKDEIAPNLARVLKSGDVVLFKASNGMKFFEIADEVKNILM